MRRSPNLSTRPNWIEADERGSFHVFDMGSGLRLFLDVADREIAADHRWYTVHPNEPLYYAMRERNIALHREIMEAPKGMVVDHRDGNGLNCRRYNMRLATDQQNRTHVHFPSKGATASGLRGVYRRPNGGRWYAQICIDYKCQFLGEFDNPVDAAKAWDIAAFAARGEFTFLNFQKQR